MESVRPSTYSIAESLQYFCAELKRIINMKGVLKVSKEQVIEIERYCNEHGITRKQRIEEFGLSVSIRLRTTCIFDSKLEATCSSCPKLGQVDSTWFVLPTCPAGVH